MECGCNKNVKTCLDSVPIFNTLDEKEKEEIFHLISHRNYKKGEIIYEAGNLRAYLFIVNSGKIKIYRLTETGKEQVIRILGPGEFLGELALFNNWPARDYAEALEVTSLCIISGRTLREHIQKNPEIAFKIIEELSKRLDFVENMLENVNHYSVDWRLAQALLKIADKYGVVELETTKANFASQIGMSQETLSRKLSLFESKNYIHQIGQRKIIITNIKALKAIK